jgi:hypothetical protein
MVMVRVVDPTTIGRLGEAFNLGTTYATLDGEKAYEKNGETYTEFVGVTPQWYAVAFATLPFFALKDKDGCVENKVSEGTGGLCTLESLAGMKFEWLE